MIIKNCPSCRDFDVFGNDNQGCCYHYNDYCNNHNDCVIKQIVKECKKHIECSSDDFVIGMTYMAKHILDLLEIED